MWSQTHPFSGVISVRHVRLFEWEESGAPAGSPGMPLSKSPLALRAPTVQTPCSEKTDPWKC